MNEIYESNRSGPVEVIERKGKNCRVRFLNTGFEREANIDNVRAGKVKDTSVEYVTPTIEMNELFTSNTCGDFLVLRRTGKTATVQFLESGFTKTANIDNVKVGKVRDPYFKSVYGKGYEGEFSKKKYSYWKQAKQLWCNMMKRCYSEKDTRGYFGKGVCVDERWLCFANFLEDLESLPNFEGWLLGYEEGNTKYNLDKDLLVEGNKVYSRELCQFVTEYENKSAGAINSMRINGPIHLRK